MGNKSIFLGSYPTTRLRRNRQNIWGRNLVAETTLLASDLIWTTFVREGNNITESVTSMPGVDCMSVDILVERAIEAYRNGIPAIAVFPKTPTQLKTPNAIEALNPNNLVCTAVRALKKSIPNLGVICDVALDPYSSHGQDGLVQNGYVVNDETIEILSKQALVQAEAGCDIIAPSDMMDGRIGEIRQELDANGYKNVQLMAYSAKFASAYYGPFREAIGSATNLGEADKKTYQMDPRNSNEALREVALDLEEGADMVMVKPGMPYLDIVYRIKNTFAVPTYVYQVSGEYAMIKAAGEKGWINSDEALMESLLSFKRAGADGILTYWAVEAAKKITNN
ncbi:MAG: porphobilinogen synthase [Gammaproteobacteria bacterium]|jgi:porphobilinogen synthase|nr:porphobilinogen synthase [Gammaproteobacteria bacterium]